MAQASIKNRRILVGTSYMASGYGRGTNTRNVYWIDGHFYAYHPKYADQQLHPLEGEFKGYIPVNQLGTGTFYAKSTTEKHDVQPVPKPMTFKEHISL